jgi:hypothetical protein
MPKPTVRNLEYIRQASPKTYEAIHDLMQAIANISNQGNTNPNGPVDPPPAISSISAVALAPGVHKVQIVDNNPVRRGIIYHFEFSTTENFQPGTVVLAQSGPSRDLIITLGAGPTFWRGFSQYPTSDPSEAVYVAGSVDAGGAARNVAITGAGSGSDGTLQQRNGGGFGFQTERNPKLPL